MICRMDAVFAYGAETEAERVVAAAYDVNQAVRQVFDALLPTFVAASAAINEAAAMLGCISERERHKNRARKHARKVRR